MARAVLLVEPDVDLLGALASKLRARGLEVWLADSFESAIARVRAARPDAALLSAGLERGLDRALRDACQAPELPCFWLTPRRPSSSPGAPTGEEADLIARRVHALPERGAGVVSATHDFRGDLAQISLVDLIQLLGSNRQSGVLVVQTALGAGEIRFTEGEVVDALYRRLEGKKALFRLLGEREGSFAFTGAAGSALLRRIDAPTHALLMDGLREIDEVRVLYAELGLGDDAWIGLSAGVGNDVASMVLSLLQTPRTVSELLDETPAPDLEVLQALRSLVRDGAVRRIVGGMRRVELSDPERLGVLAALAKRVARPGFRDAGRLAIAAGPGRLLEVMAGLGRIAEAIVPSEAVPTTPIPHVLATLRLGEGVELEVMGVPLVDAYAPIWALVLPSCAALALLEAFPREVLENACQLSGVPVLRAYETFGVGEDASPEAIARLVQRLLEAAAGA